MLFRVHASAVNRWPPNLNRCGAKQPSRRRPWVAISGSDRPQQPIELGLSTLDTGPTVRAPSQFAASLTNLLAYNGGSSPLFGELRPPSKTRFHNLRSTPLQFSNFEAALKRVYSSIHGDQIACSIHGGSHSWTHLKPCACFWLYVRCTTTGSQD